MVLTFDGISGCLGTTKALQIGGSLGSICIQALAYRLCDFLLGFPKDDANCELLNFESQ